MPKRTASRTAPELASQAKEKPAVPTHISRQLTTGEIIFWSSQPQYRTRGRPGKWVAEVRRRQPDGRQVDFPVRGFHLPQDALAYILTTRPGGAESLNRERFTVADLYEEWRRHGWKRNEQVTRTQKERRWRLHIAPRWALYRLSEVRRRDAQDWISELEEQAEVGELSFGNPTIREMKNDLHGMFDFASSQEFTERANPFKDLELAPLKRRKLLTIESKDWSAIWWAAEKLAETQRDAVNTYANSMIVDMIKVSILTGLRKGELIVLEWSRIDFAGSRILVHRALRDETQEIDERTGQPVGPTLKVAVNFPKKDKLRDIPMCAQAREVFKKIEKGRPQVSVNASGERDFVFRADSGSMLSEQTVDRRWERLCEHLQVLAKGDQIRSHRLYPIMKEMRSKGISLPAYWDKVDWRDMRNSFASYMREVRIPDGERQVYLGHGPRSVTDAHYERVTTAAFAAAVEMLTNGWTRESFA
jgi:integrase